MRTFVSIDLPTDIQTTNATQISLCEVTLPNNCAGRMEAWVHMLTPGGNAKGIHLEAYFKRVSGTTTLVQLNLLNAFNTVADGLVLALATATIDVSGDKLRLRITGISGTIDWIGRCFGEYDVVS